MSDELIGVRKTVLRAESALRELMTEGAGVSQHAVEKRAGLANGALNYNCPEYRALRETIRTVKAAQQKATTNGESRGAHHEKLKEKYRHQRNELREEIKHLMAENVELLHNLMLMQQYVRELERISGSEKGRVVSFSSDKNE